MNSHSWCGPIFLHLAMPWARSWPMREDITKHQKKCYVITCRTWVLHQEHMSDWDEGCVPKDLLRPHSRDTSNNTSGCPQIPVVVDTHRRRGYRRGKDSRSNPIIHGANGYRVKVVPIVTNDNLETSDIHEVNRTRVNAVKKQNGNKEDLSIWTIPILITRYGEMTRTSLSVAVASLVAGTAMNPDTHTKSVVTEIMYNVEIVVNSVTNRSIATQTPMSIRSSAMKVSPTTVW